MHIWDPREPATDKNRIQQGRIVIAWQDHDWGAGIREHPSYVIEHSGTELVVLKGIAGQKNDIGSPRSSSCQHTAEVGRVSAVDMNIRAVNQRHLGHITPARN